MYCYFTKTSFEQDQLRLYQAHSYTNLWRIPSYLMLSFFHFFSNNLFSLKPPPSQHDGILTTEALPIKFIISDWFVRGKANALMASLMNIQRPCLESSSWLLYPFTAEVEETKPSCLADCDGWPYCLMSPLEIQRISGCSHL